MACSAWSPRSTATSGLAEATPPDAVQLVGDGLTVAGSRPLGAVHLLDGLWRVLEIDTALRKVLGPRCFTPNVERVCFALVANARSTRCRSCRPRSEPAATWRSTGWRRWTTTRPTGDGPAGGSRRAGRGVRSGVLHRGQSAQSQGRSAVLRHHQHVLPARHRGQRRRRVSPLRALKRIIATTRRRS